MHPHTLRHELFRAHEELIQLRFKLRRRVVIRSPRDLQMRQRQIRRAQTLERQTRTMKVLLTVAWKHQEAIAGARADPLSHRAAEPRRCTTFEPRRCNTSKVTRRKSAEGSAHSSQAGLLISVV